MELIKFFENKKKTKEVFLVMDGDILLCFINRHHHEIFISLLPKLAADIEKARMPILKKNFISVNMAFHWAETYYLMIKVAFEKPH